MEKATIFQNILPSIDLCHTGNTSLENQIWATFAEEQMITVTVFSFPYLSSGIAMWNEPSLNARQAIPEQILKLLDPNMLEISDPLCLSATGNIFGCSFFQDRFNYYAQTF